MVRKSYRIRFPGGNGHELAGIIDRPDPPRPAPVAVFSHCFTCNKDLKAIVRVSRAMAERGIAVLRYDMTGLGGSDGDFSLTNFTSNLADLRAAIDFAESELGSVSALVGHSFGGAASLAVAGTDQRERLRCVVTLAAPSDTQHLAALLHSMDPRIQQEGIGQVNIGGRQWTIRREMLDDFRGHDLPSALAEIRTPTMLIHSPDDKTVHFDHALRIMGLISGASHPGTAVSLLSLDGADHLLSESPSDIELVASTAAAFIARCAVTE